jgi:hypothetical protein
MNDNNWRTLQDAKSTEIGQGTLQFFDSRTASRVIFGGSSLSFRPEATHVAVKRLSKMFTNFLISCPIKVFVWQKLIIQIRREHASAS